MVAEDILWAPDINIRGIAKNSVELSWPKSRCASGYQFMVAEETFCHEDCLDTEKIRHISEGDIELNTGILIMIS